MEFIDLSKQLVNIRSNIDKRIANVLNHGRFIMGPEVLELEKKLADYVGVKHCISCSSGTDALVVSLMSKGIGSGDAVITTPFTYIATAEAIRLVGATPIFIDIDLETFNMDPSLIHQGIDYAKKNRLNPKAIIPVDIFGLCAEYTKIEKIAEKHNLFVVEDGAQSFGASINNKKSGSFGHVGTTSFFPAKPLGCYGDGGAIFTNDDKLIEIMKSIRIHGGGTDKYENIRIGINGRLDTIQAAILLEKFNIFKNELEYRKNIAAFYTSRLEKYFTIQKIPDGYKSSWAQYSILARSTKDRESIMLEMQKNDIPVMIYYHTPLHLQKVFKDLGYSYRDFPNATRISKKIFSIPMHPYLDETIQDKIINTLLSIK